MTHVCRNKHTGKYEVKILRLRAVTGEPPLLPSDASTLQPQNGTFGNIRAQAPLLNVLLTAQQRERKHQEAKMNMSMDMDMDMDMDTKNDEEQRQRQNRKKHRQLLPNPSGARLIAMIHKYAQLHEEPLYHHLQNVHGKFVKPLCGVLSLRFGGRHPTRLK